ncbi:unnamed protein product, partial [Prorocentrum cordatum]
MRGLLEKADLPEVKRLLGRALWPAPKRIAKPSKVPDVCWLGGCERHFPSGELFHDGSQFEGDYEQCASEADAFLRGASEMLREPHVDINGREIMALIMVLTFAVPPVTVIVDSGFASSWLTELGPRRTTAHGAARAHQWREVWRLLDERGGLNEDGLSVRKVPAHESRRTVVVVVDGKITYKEWFGNHCADRAARSAAEAGRIAPAGRRRPAMADKLVESAGMWVGAVGGVMEGRGTTHRVAEANCPTPEAVAAVGPVAKLVCDWRGSEGKRRCSRCRWMERASECPGSIVAAVLSHNEAPKQAGKDVHMLVQLKPQCEADLVREMPVEMCAACGVLVSARASSFAAACGHPSAKGK